MIVLARRCPENKAGEEAKRWLRARAFFLESTTGRDRTRFRFHLDMA